MRLVCLERQGVHSMYEGGIDRLWKPDEDRTNKLVFIGQKLDEKTLRSNFEACLFKPEQASTA